MKLNKLFKITILAAASVLATACVHYQPTTALDSPGYEPLEVSSTSLAGKSLPAHKIEPGQALDLTTLELLAVSHNPHLVERRTQMHVQELELVTAGMLPEPVFSGGRDHPISGPDHFTAWNNSLGFDLTSLLIHRKLKQFSQLQSESIHLNLLWQEWLILGQVRSTCFQLSFDEKLITLLNEETLFNTTLLDRQKRAVEQGLLIRPVLLETEHHVLAIKSMLHDAQEEKARDFGRLHDLLGINPDITLKLAPLPLLKMPLNPQELIDRRPDLLALRRAAQAGDIGLRMAIVEQFPDLSLGLNDSRDTADNHTLGLSVQLPLSFLGQTQARARLAEARRMDAETTYRLRLAQGQRDLRWLKEQIRLQQTRVKQANSTWLIICAPMAHWQSLLNQGVVTLEMVESQNRSCLERHLDLVREQHKLDLLQLDVMTLSGYVPEWERIQHV